MTLVATCSLYSGTYKHILLASFLFYQDRKVKILNTYPEVIKKKCSIHTGLLRDLNRKTVVDTLYLVAPRRTDANVPPSGVLFE